METQDKETYPVGLTKGNADWAWYVFMIGLDIKTIAERLEDTEEEVSTFVNDVIRGEVLVHHHSFPLMDRQPVQKWTKRQHKILLKAKAAGQSLTDTARLLEREPASVKAQLKLLSNG